MPKIKKTPDNPFGLSTKQRVVIEEYIQNVKNGNGESLSDVHHRVYNTKTKEIAASNSNENVNKQNFREALLAGLRERKILGKNGKLEQRLAEGLDAKTRSPTGEEIIDYKARLAYIKELNKIAGAHAPQQTENRNLNVNVNDSENVDKKLSDLLSQVIDVSPEEEKK